MNAVILTITMVLPRLITAEENNWTSEECSKESKSLLSTLWDNNIDIVKETEHTDFLICMTNGSLVAERYMKFILQDIYYVKHLTKLLSILANSSEPRKDLHEFFNNRNASYSRFATSLLKGFGFQDFSELLPSAAIKAYIESYQALMMEDPIYFVIGLLPCAMLWPYIAQNLQISDSSPYINFKINNMADNSRKHYEKLLETHRHTMDEKKANEIFRTQMEHEKSFFAES
ncbi:uncharacterized protein LOC122811066 isoform X1 [Protopterus annectens]|uniref:uncharacterized protein LOC122811066 isoform X1 n=1 Tax=Protopterus annectens TaxID=7888 RepID=UPI001CF98807|nr:uncharacterized protein LOC122811066 isoform X1 [Protopterus annectens]